jgi:hypothetical protein
VTIIIILAQVQAVVSALRATEWFRAGTEIMGRGLVLLPLLGAIVFMLGVLAVGVPLLYVLFAGAAFFGRRRAWTIGMFATVLNLLGVIAVALTGTSLSEILPRAAGAIVIFAYLIAPTTRRTLGARSG